MDEESVLMKSLTERLLCCRKCDDDDWRDDESCKDEGLVQNMADDANAAEEHIDGL